jgi:hypothetical protein
MGTHREIRPVLVQFCALGSGTGPDISGNVPPPVQFICFPQPVKTMRRLRQILAIAMIFSATPSLAEPDTIMFAAMPGKCSTLKVAGRNFACRAVAYYQDEEGRGNFVIALDDPADDRHIITFSGENGRKPLDNLYELPIDRMLLKSRDRPKVDGLPVPDVESSSGMCKQVGSFATRRVSSIACTAADRTGKQYELQFESDGLPINVRRVRRTRAGLPAVSPFN